MTKKQIAMDEMKLRDYFAGQVLQGIMSSEGMAALFSKDEKEPIDAIAETAYLMAEAMLQARNGTY